jgi:hypothetical protein
MRIAMVFYGKNTGTKKTAPAVQYVMFKNNSYWVKIEPKKAVAVMGCMAKQACCLLVKTGEPHN